MENSPPLVFQRSETRGEFSLAEVFLVKILTYFLVILCFVFEKKTPAPVRRSFSKIFVFFHRFGTAVARMNRPSRPRLNPEALLLIDLPSPSSRRTIQKGNDHYGLLLGAAGENFEVLEC